MQSEPRHYGPLDKATYRAVRDASRLNQQTWDVWNVLADGRWHYLADIARQAGHKEPSVSARLRDLRKERFGGHAVLREYRDRGLWAYLLIPNAALIAE